MSFRERLEAWDRPLLTYEVIPPPHNAPREEVVDTAVFIRDLLSDHDVDAVNIPDVRNESRSGNRKAAFMKKRDPRQFAMTLADIFGGQMDLIVNRCTVYETEEEQEAWLKATFEKFNIHNLILVGGESSDIDYPGPSVPRCTEIATRIAQETGTDASFGGITIPTRRREGFDEPDRMINKIEHGAQFFTSQVIFEPHSSCQLLSDYDKACQEAGIDPAPVFLSFAPITGNKDARFLEWLGVEIPGPCKQWILDTHARALDRSVRAAEHALKQVFDHVRRQELSVPVGVNVEHVMRYNFEASEVLLDRLESLIGWHQLEIENDTP